MTKDMELYGDDKEERKINYRKMIDSIGIISRK